VKGYTPRRSDSGLRIIVGQRRKPRTSSLADLRDPPVTLHPALGTRESAARKRDDRPPAFPAHEEIVYTLRASPARPAIASKAVAQDLRGVQPLSVPASLQLQRLHARLDDSCLDRFTTHRKPAAIESTRRSDE